MAERPINAENAGAIEQGVYAHLEEILSSAEFRNSTKYKALLRYLVERSLSGDTPHEIDIAVDVFGKDHNYDPTESSAIRVCVHQLRKKLNEYYTEHSPASNIRITIPKGSYRISFGPALVPRPSTNNGGEDLTIHESTSVRSVALCLALAFSFSVNIFLLFGSSPTSPDRIEIAELPNSFAWQGLVEGDEPVLIALGDFFTFEATNSAGRKHLVRDIAINSPEDLNQPTGQGYTSTVLPSEITYLPKSTAFTLEALLPIAKATGKPISLKLMSEVTGEDLRHHDVIYVGFIRSMGPLRSYFFGVSNFSSNPPFVELYHKGTGETFGFSGDLYGHAKDYGLFAKFAGPGNGEILVFSGIRDIGVLHAVRALTEQPIAGGLGHGLESTLAEFPSSIEILFEASGYARSDLEANLITASPLPHEEFTRAASAIESQ